ncbi:MAG: hypothetical protein IJA15_00085 [Clostridia bacterium]|nr:hypothetical protein [Clostridia bacterium]
MTKYLKRGILCAMALLSLIVLFAPFYKSIHSAFYFLGDLEHLDFYLSSTGDRGIFYILAGFDSARYFGFESEVLGFINHSIFWIELIAGLGLCALSVIVFIKGDNGLFSKIIIFASIAITFVYFSQVVIRCFNSSRYFFDRTNLSFFKKIRWFLTQQWKAMSKSSLILFITNVALGICYFFTEKNMPSEE